MGEYLFVAWIVAWFGSGAAGSQICFVGINNKYPRVARNRWGDFEFMMTIFGPFNLFVALSFYGIQGRKGW